MKKVYYKIAAEKIAAHIFPASNLAYKSTPNGILVSLDGSLVAWIYPGYAGGLKDSKRQTFFDVAFPSLTFQQGTRPNSSMLGAESFDSLASAIKFVEDSFSSPLPIPSKTKSKVYAMGVAA